MIFCLEQQLPWRMFSNPFFGNRSHDYLPLQYYIILDPELVIQRSAHVDPVLVCFRSAKGQIPYLRILEKKKSPDVVLGVVTWLVG